jgi:hypothetical protein
LATDFFNSEVWSWFGLVVSFLTSLFRFGRHPSQLVRTALHWPRLVLQAQMRQSFEIGLWMQRWAHHVAQQAHASVSDGTPLDQVGAAFELTDRRLISAQPRGQVMILFAAHAESIRDGPIHRHQWLEGLWIDDEREAA